jgi:sugar phosphate isomerase/epimerase
MTPSDENEPAPRKALLKREQVFLSVTEGMGVTPEHVASHGLGVEIQDFAALSGMRGAKSEHLEFWHGFFEKYNPLRTFHAPFIDLHPGSDDPEERKYAEKQMAASFEVAAELGAALVVMHSCWPPPSFRKYGNWDNLNHIREFIAKMGEIASNLGLPITIENVYEPEPSLLRDIITDIDAPNIKLCLDTGHANIKSAIPLNEWVKVYGANLAYLHLHDNNGKKDRHMALGEGSIDFGGFFDSLWETQYDGLLCIESWPKRWNRSIDRLKAERII